MFNTVKVNVTFLSEGILLPSEEGIISYKVLNKDLLENVNSNLSRQEAFKVVREGKTYHHFKEPAIVKRFTQLSLGAYNHLTSLESIPHKITKKNWSRLSKNKRLEYHLADMMIDYGAYDFSYEVLED